MNEDTQKGFEMILHAGNAKTMAMESMDFAEQGAFEQAEEKLQDAEHEVVMAHHVHKGFLDELANGKSIEMDLILTHALDHLSSAELICLMAQKMIHIYKKGR